MKIPAFTFKNEAIWMIGLTTAPLLIAFLALVMVRLLR